MLSKAPTLSVIIPCYNEQKNLERGVLDEVYQYLQQQDLAFELLIINDGSSDDSRELVERCIQTKDNAYLYSIVHGGKPAAIWEGIQKAAGDVLLFTDMDQSTPIIELDKLWPWYERGFEVVIGSRKMGRTGFSLTRKLGSLVFLTLRRLVLLHDIADTQCGFKLCGRQAALDVFPRLEFLSREIKPAGWKVTAYDVEFLYLLHRLGCKIKEVPVEWENRDQSDTKGSASDLGRYVAESIDMARQVLRVKRNQLLGLYD